MAGIVTYQVFARKYRPQHFDDVVGQDHIIRTLKNAIEQNRLAHAYLFVGPRGTGKTSTARIIAKALNCQQGPTVTPCGECDACKEIAAGTSLDVLEIDGASNNGVEQVRELRDNVRFAPTRGKYKIYIIDEVHMLTSAAFNALLKTLEEPPEHVKFIFATTEPQKVLPTILSRCQRFDLRRIPATLIAKHLQYIAGQEKIALDDAAADAVARGAEGGLRDAESMLDQLVAFCGDRVTEQDVLDVFGFTAQLAIADLGGAILRQDSSAALGLLYDMAEDGKDMMKLMGDLLAHFRNLLVYAVDPAAVRSELSAEMQSALQEQSPMAGREQMLSLIDIFAACESRMKWAPNKRLHFEIGIIKAVQTLGQATLDDVLETLAALREGREAPVKKKVEHTLPQTLRYKKPPASTPRVPPAAPSSAPEPPAPPSSSTAPEAAKAAPSKLAPPEPGAASSPSEVPEPARAVDADNEQCPDEVLVAVWQELLRSLQKIKPPVFSLLALGAPIAREESTLLVGFSPEQSVQMEYLLRPTNMLLLKECLEKCSGNLRDIKLEIREGVQPMSLPPEKEQTVAAEDFHNDPKIKMALEIFKGRLLTT